MRNSIPSAPGSGPVLARRTMVSRFNGFSGTGEAAEAAGVTNGHNITNAKTVRSDNFEKKP